MNFTYHPPAHTRLDVLFQDNHLLILNKPAGLLAVLGRGEDKQDCLASRVQVEFPEALIVHRLDMATSGILLFARSSNMQRQLSILFQRREVKKYYLAVVAGNLVVAEGEINLPLGRDWSNRPRQKIDCEQGKPALTRYKVLHYDAQSDTSRIALEPVTGRTHQLRLHLAALGHPILGDTLYAGRMASRLYLHAEKLELIHPVTGENLVLQHPASF